MTAGETYTISEGYYWGAPGGSQAIRDAANSGKWKCTVYEYPSNQQFTITLTPIAPRVGFNYADVTLSGATGDYLIITDFESENGASVATAPATKKCIVGTFARVITAGYRNADNDGNLEEYQKTSTFSAWSGYGDVQALNGGTWKDEIVTFRVPMTDLTLASSYKDAEPSVTAPTIAASGQPTSTTAVAGKTASFTVTASGDNLSYQWQVNRNDSKGWVDITGSTSATHTTDVLNTSYNGFQYRCVITNTAGSVTTNEVTLTVNAADSGSDKTDKTTDKVADLGKGTLTVAEDTSDASAPKTTVATKASDIVEILKKDGNLSVSDLAKIEAGDASVDVVLSVKNAEKTMDADTVDLIAKKAKEKNLTIAEYMDITLTKYIIPTGSSRDAVTGSAIEELGSGIDVTIEIPESFKNTDATKTRTYYIIRKHGDEVAVLGGTLAADGTSFTFTTDRFSDYVLTYQDTDKTADTTAAATTAATVTSSPKTGEAGGFGWMAALVCFGAAGVFVTELKRERRRG